MITVSAATADSPRRTQRLPIATAACLTMLVLGGLVSYGRFHFVSMEMDSGIGDYGSYIQTAEFFNGAPHAAFSPQRILKPLNPLLTALLQRGAGSYLTAFFVQVYAFYLAMILVAFYFYRSFFDGDLTAAIFCTALLAFGYPMLRYGLGAYTETGAIFFYCASLYTSYLFLKQPTNGLFAATAAINATAFLWKEYAAVTVVIFGLVILFHPQLSFARKLLLIALLGAIVLAVSGAWQLYVYRTYHYTYLDWYVHGGLTGPAHNLTLYNVIKSLFALLIAGWPLIPLSYAHYRGLANDQRRFLLYSLFPPFLCLAWGAVSSRLFYVCVPMLVVLAWLGLKRLTRLNSARYAVLAAILLLDVAWLVMAVRSGPA